MKLNRNFILRLLFASALLVALIGIYRWTDSQSAQASGSYLTQFRTQYPAAAGSQIDSCSVCHTSSIPATNSYGSAFASNGHSFTAIENLDSDGDGFSNLQEISALTFPGDANSHPAVGPTNTPVPPTATPTRTQVPPTATSTSPSPTGVPPTATATSPAPTGEPPTATATLPAPTQVAPTVSPTPSVTPVPPGSVSFKGVIRSLPARRNWIGYWRVGSRRIQVNAKTSIQLSEDARVRVGASVVGLGIKQKNGTILAAWIRVVSPGGDD